MRKLILLLITLTVLCPRANSQSFGIGTNLPDSHAILDVVSMDKGVLIPRMNTIQRDSIMGLSIAQRGLLIYNVDTAEFNYWDGTQWVGFSSTTGNTLDEAYDEGGAGVGRIIYATDGAVEINGTGGLEVNANTSTLSSALLSNNTNGTNNSEAKIAYVGNNAGNRFAFGIRANANITSANSIFDGAYGVYGTVGHPSNGTINLNTAIGTRNKLFGVAGFVMHNANIVGGQQDMVASVCGFTGSHNSGGKSVTGTRLYAGLFAGNGRTVGLWGENSTYMELIPRHQNRDYDTGIIGFYNTDTGGGNNNGNIGSGESYLSIEANITDATVKHVVIQTRSVGNVGIGTSGPSAKLSVNGTANKTGGGSWSVFSDLRMKKNIEKFNDGLDVVMKIDPITFKYNGEGGVTDTETEYVGIIAQDMLEIAPYMVSTVDYVETEMEGAVTIENEYFQFDPSSLDFILVNAVQEQQVQIKQQDIHINDQQVLIESLEDELSRLKVLVSQLIEVR